jgi:hypothetical protein
MSENYHYYVEKVAEARRTRALDHPLQSQIDELFRMVRECEAMWALQDRIERA